MPIRLVAAAWEQLPRFIAMEQDEETAVFIAPYTLAQHQTSFQQFAVNYLAIMAAEQLVGFMLTALDADGESVELRRLVVSVKGHGIGQRALVLLERPWVGVLRLVLSAVVYLQVPKFQNYYQILGQ